MKTNLKNKSDINNFKRIMIIGCPGSGKSTLSEKLSRKLKIPKIHLDKIYWKPNWEAITKEEFDKCLEKVLKESSWIIDGNYNRTIQKRLTACDLVIYLDYDTNECLNNYYKRVENKSIKGFITDGCIEKINEEFIEYIKSFNEKNKEKYNELILKSNKTYLIFASMEELNNYFEG